jgi:hypothetical protein
MRILFPLAERGRRMLSCWQVNSEMKMLLKMLLNVACAGGVVGYVLMAAGCGVISCLEKRELCTAGRGADDCGEIAAKAYRYCGGAVLLCAIWTCARSFSETSMAKIAWFHVIWISTARSSCWQQLVGQRGDA